MATDRRRPVARYVLFADPATQERFVEAAEAAYQDLVRLDSWSGSVPLTLAAPTAPPPAKRHGLRRRASEGSPQPEHLLVSGGLAEAGVLGRDLPARVESLEGCAAERRLASTMGRVACELVSDLAAVPAEKQAGHPAYRQTLRLAAELRGLHDVLSQRGCRDPFGCVRPRAPEQWGRREEDVEIAEVRAVLLELAAHRDG
jgi:hypothetical protein